MTGARNYENNVTVPFRETCGRCGARRIDNQIGLEPTLAEHIERLVGVFEQVRRVLRPDGVAFVNYGDAYAGYHGNKNSEIPTSATNGWTNGTNENKRGSALADGLKPKDLCLIPHRLAIALQDRGWWVRSDIIWAKPNPMPESVTDRPTNAHEHVFLLTKNGADPTFWTHERGKGGSRTRPEPDYIWRHTGGEESTEPRTGQGWTRRNLWRGSAYWWDAEAVREAEQMKPQQRLTPREANPDAKFHGQPVHRRPEGGTGGGRRNLRNVWTIPSYPFSEAHFATFPPKLVETCLKAGCPERVCADCGAPYVREVEKTRTFESGSGRAGNMPNGKHGPDMQGGGETLDIRRGPCVQTKTLGFSPSCDCRRMKGPGQLNTAAGTVLDPFGGSGTTGLVADRMNRNAVLIELSADYCEMARRRIEGDAPMFASVELQAEGA